METINGSLIMTYNSKNDTIVNDSQISAGLPLSADTGHIVKSYKELLFKIASLNFYNEKFQLLFRGQRKDYSINDKVSKSNLYPSILRTQNKEVGIKRRKEIINNFEKLKKAQKLLEQEFGRNYWGNSHILQWAIIQHYGICSTPLLDVTDSIQIAISFAVEDADEGYLYILGVPHRTGAISISIESKTQIIDLTQICPPQALRPHFQSGLLIGDYPDFDEIEKTHGKQGMIGNNFSCRLLTKFHLQNCRNWKNEGFNVTPNDILFPNDDDEFYKRIEKIKNQL